MKEMLHVYSNFSHDWFECYFTGSKKQFRASTIPELIALIVTELKNNYSMILDYSMAGITYDLPFHLSCYEIARGLKAEPLHPLHDVWYDRIEKEFNKQWQEMMEKVDAV